LVLAIVSSGIVYGDYLFMRIGHILYFFHLLAEILILSDIHH